LAEVVDDEFFDRVPDVVLGAVMMYQQSDRHAGRRGNRPHRGAVFALAGVEVERGVADPGLSCQVLIACAGVQLWRHLITDPPVPYAEISARLGIPVDSIGPKRSRYLDKLRRDPAICALINAVHGRQDS
jgi:hypothetical protein